MGQVVNVILQQLLPTAHEQIFQNGQVTQGIEVVHCACAHAIAHARILSVT